MRGVYSLHTNLLGLGAFYKKNEELERDGESDSMTSFYFVVVRRSK